MRFGSAYFNERAAREPTAPPREWPVGWIRIKRTDRTKGRRTSDDDRVRGTRSQLAPDAGDHLVRDDVISFEKAGVDLGTTNIGDAR